MRTISRVAIAGAGTMGYSLAQAFARYGYDVTLYDLFPAALEKAKGLIALNQSTEVDSGKLTAEESAEVLALADEMAMKAAYRLAWVLNQIFVEKK